MFMKCSRLCAFTNMFLWFGSCSHLTPAAEPLSVKGLSALRASSNVMLSLKEHWEPGRAWARGWHCTGSPSRRNDTHDLGRSIRHTRAHEPWEHGGAQPTWKCFADINETWLVRFSWKDLKHHLSSKALGSVTLARERFLFLVLFIHARSPS